MPRGGGGRKGGHKGKARRFNNPEEIDAQMKEDPWREPAKEGSDEEARTKTFKTISDTDSDSDAEDEAQKGVSHLIEIQNPNRIANKMKKASQVDVEQSGTAALSRREREEIERQEAKERYMKLRKEGKTPEAQADLARLAIIRQQREEAAKRKEAEKKAREDAKAAQRKK